MVCILYIIGIKLSYTLKGEIKMEFWLLAKVGMVINGIVFGGYTLAGSYLVRTGYKYVQDYKESVARDKELN